MSFRAPGRRLGPCRSPTSRSRTPTSSRRVFSSTIAAKAWFATAAVVLALVQVTTAARIYGKLSFLPERGPAIARTHRWSGRLAFLLTLPVFFHCVTILGFQTPDARVAVHAIVGTFFYGVFAAKVLVVRDHSLPGWALPTAGSDAGVDAGRPLAHVEPLVLHDREVRLLMGRGWRPILVGGAVVVGTFALAKAHVFEPSAPAASSAATGDASRGADGLRARVRGLSRLGRDGGRSRSDARWGRPRRGDRDGSGAAGPRHHARRSRQRAGGGGRRRLRRLDLEPRPTRLGGWRSTPGSSACSSRRRSSSPASRPTTRTSSTSR